MTDTNLHQTVKQFNLRNYAAAVRWSAEGLATAQGRDEAFWMGLHEACEGYHCLHEKEMVKAENKLVTSMQKLRNFGFQYKNFEITGALAGIRLAIEEIRAVRLREKRVFDVSLLPQFRLAAKADEQ